MPVRATVLGLPTALRPEPVSVIVWGLPAALLVTVRTRVASPTTVGLKLTDRLQDLPAVRVVGQVPMVAVYGPAGNDSGFAANTRLPGPLFETLTLTVRVVPTHGYRRRPWPG